MDVLFLIALIVGFVIVLFAFFGGYFVNKWMPADNMKQGDVMYIYLNNEYNRKATISKVEENRLFIYDKLPLPLSYRGKFYAVGVDVSDNSRFLYMKKRIYIIPCRIVERFRKSIGLDQYLDNLPVSDAGEAEENEEKERRLTMKCSEITYRPLSELVLLETNPRTIKKADMDRLVDSIKIYGFWKHRPITLSDRTGKLVVIAGNQRLKAAKKLKLKEVPTVVYSDLTEYEEKNIIIRDNINNGEWDFNALKVDDVWKDTDFDFMGLTIPEDTEPKKSKKKSVEEDEPEDDARNDEQEDDSDEGNDKEAFYRSMFKDVLYESDNIFEIPNLLLEMQAGKLELPLSPWGANSRLRKDVVTYHFYVDDYRFEALFKDPINLLTSGCKAVVEPNCSCHDQTPIAWGLQLIYKKRWLSRYFQECGIRVYADLNVSHKFIEYNKMGIPKGYNAFATRGLDGWMESLKSDLQVAQEISGLEKPNLLVYGGGEEVKAFCRKHGLLYVTDFINAKKK